MIHALKDAHAAATRFFAAPLVKPTLTHTGVAGFGIEFLHALFEALHHAIPAVVSAFGGLVLLDEHYSQLRDLNLGYAALALGLVIYADNAAHHVHEKLVNACALNPKEKP